MAIIITTLLQIKKPAILAVLIKEFTILQRQFATVFMMLLFIAVQAIKVGHTHDVLIKTETAAKATIQKATFACSICDYDFAKDKDHYFSAVVINCKLIPLTHFAQNTYAKPTSIGACSSDRGPPSLLL